MVGCGDIWPERPMLNLAGKWGWKTKGKNIPGAGGIKREGSENSAGSGIKVVIGDDGKIAVKNCLGSSADAGAGYGVESIIRRYTRDRRARALLPDGQPESPAEAPQDGLPQYLSGFADRQHPAESAGLILSEGYLASRWIDILEDVRRSLDFYEWLSDIIEKTISDRLDEERAALLEDFAAYAKYREMQKKHHISSKTIPKRRDEISLAFFDQIVASSNAENG